MIQPIEDEFLADKAIDLFIAEYEPLLYAADLGATPQQVWDTIRTALKHCRDNHTRPTAGRKTIETNNPKTIAQRNWRAKKK